MDMVCDLSCAGGADDTCGGGGSPADVMTNAATVVVYSPGGSDEVTGGVPDDVDPVQAMR